MTGLDRESDADLLHRVKDGDKAAFGLLYERHRQPLFAFCNRLLRDSALAEDAVHETFIRIFKFAHTLLHSGASRSWIFCIARNEALMILRRRRETTEVDQDGIWEDTTPLSILEQKEEVAVVQMLVNLLRAEYREVIQLREYEQLSYAEIARITGDTESSVKSKLFRARQALARALAPWYKGRTSQ